MKIYEIIFIFQAIHGGKFGPFGPFGPFAGGAGLTMFGAPAGPLMDPLIYSQLQIAQLTQSIRTLSIQAGMQIGFASSLIGRQINSAKLSTNMQIIQAKNGIKLAENDATLQGLDVANCVTDANNAIALINVNDLKACAKSGAMLDARQQISQLKLLQTSTKNILKECNTPTTLDVPGCVTEKVNTATQQVDDVREAITTALNNASQGTCVTDAQATLEESVADALNDFNTCVADAPAMVAK